MIPIDFESCALLMAMAISDTVWTIVAVDSGRQELNPFMAWLLSISIAAFVGYKILATLCACGCFWRGRQHRWVRLSFDFVFWIYVGVLVCQALGFILSGQMEVSL